jgi:DNA modification methylase
VARASRTRARDQPELTHIAEPLRPLAIPVTDLALDPANARLHPERNLGSIEASLRLYGQRKPIVVRREGMVVEAGNGTVEAARRLGWTHLAAVVVDDDPVTATGYAISDNRTAELAEWDDEVLARLLRDLRTEEVDLDSLGWSDTELDTLLSELEGAGEGPPGGEDPGAGEPTSEPVSKRGEVYQLGPHRLMCGDSTNPEDVATLMAGEQAVLMATDPPYLVNYKGGNHPQSWHNKAEVKDKHWDDYVDQDAGVEFFEAFLRVALERHVVPGVAVYQWHAHKRQALVEEAWTRAGLLCHQQIIWVKARAVLTRSHFMWQHEPCFYGWVQGTPPTRRPPNNETTVWAIDQKGNSDGIHPTQKPLEIFARPIRWHTRPGELCYEPFAGSGTCLIAAAMEGRRCYAMELSPGFVDAIRIRWTHYARSAGLDPGSGALEPPLEAAA